MEAIKVKEDKLEFVDIDGGGIPNYNYKGKPFTGIMMEYYDNDLYREVEYVNGCQEGLIRVYYENGKVDYECYKKNNKLNGVYKDWDEQGNLISTTNWKDGEKQ